MPKPILVEGCRVLRPIELESLLNHIPKLDNITRCKVSLYTGMRIVELRRWHRHDSQLRVGNKFAWYDPEHGFITLPKDQAVKKKKIVHKERWVRLNQQGKGIIPHFLKLRRPFPGKLDDNATWNENLKRWAEYAEIGIEGICPKMFRKTWESYLFFVFRENIIEICKSQGHSGVTAFDHYVGSPFVASEKGLMLNYVGGWI